MTSVHIVHTVHTVHTQYIQHTQYTYSTYSAYVRTVHTSHRSLAFLISSRVNSSGESPPWTQRNCLFMRALRGRQSKEFIHSSYTASEYLILPTQVCTLWIRT